MSKMTLLAVAIGTSFVLHADVLTWNGVADQKWDSTTANWLNAGGEAVWSNGSVAEFGDGGVRPVTITAGEKTVSGLVFSGTTATEINADIPGQLSTQHFINHGLTILSPDGTNPGVIDASAVGSAGGTIVANVTDLVYDGWGQCVSGTRVYDAATKFLPATSKDGTEAGQVITYWKNRTLANIKSVRAIIVYNSTHVENVARALYFENDGTTATVQFQTRNQGEDPYATRICVAVEFKQVGADITAQIKYARYVRDTESTFEAYRFTGDEHPQLIYDNDVNTGMGYGIRTIMAGEAAVDAGKGLAVKTGGCAPYAGVLNDGTRDGGQTGPVVCWQNLKLSEIDHFTADSFTFPNVWKPARSYYPTWSADGQSLTVLFERYNDTTTYDFCTAVKMRFTQDGDNVKGEWLGAGYTFCCGENDTTDDGHVGILPITDQWVHPNIYGVKNILPHLKPRVAIRGQLDVAGGVKIEGNGALTVASAAITGKKFSGAGDLIYCRSPRDRAGEGQGIFANVANSYAGETIVDGAEMVITDRSAVPSGGTLIVANGSDVTFKIGDSPQSGGNLTTFIYPGSTVRHVGANGLAWNFGATDVINVFGGTFDVDHQMHYMGELSLRDGGLVKSANGKAFRLGGQPDYARIFSSGSGTNEISSGIYLYHAKDQNDQYITVNTTAPLKFSGTLQASNAGAGFNASRIRKIGPSKMIFASTCRNPTDENANTVTVEVVEGTFRTEHALAFHQKNALVIHDGATVEIAPGVATANAALTVAAPPKGSAVGAVLDLGRGASYTIASADRFSIASGAKLVLKGEAGTDSLRIGTSKCLSAAQLASIKCLSGGRERRVVQDDRGYVYYGGGLTIIMR